MIWFRFVLISLSLFLSADAAGIDEKESLLRENAVLESELKLSRKSDLYFVVNLKEKHIQIKSKGILLKELPLQQVSIWGTPLSPASYILMKKSSFIKPRRENIKPGDARERDNFEIDALELADMPSQYTLSMNKGLSISVRPKTEGLMSGVCSLFSSTMRFVFRPLHMVWNTVRGKPYTAVDVVLDRESAKALYWSFIEGKACIVYPR